MSRQVRKRVGADFEAGATDGTRIRGTRYDGASSGPRLVMVHSLAMDRTFWDMLIDLLPGDCSIIAYDCRGHGASDKPTGPYTIETFGDDLAAVLDHAGWPSAAVAGASMGGCATLAFAIRHRARVAGLGLIDTTDWYGEDAPAAWEKRAEKAENEGLASLIPFQVTRWFTETFRKVDPQATQACIDVFLANDIAAYAATCRMLGRVDLRAGLSSLNIPVNIIVGEQDYATPVAMARDMQQRIPNASLRVIPHAMHLTPVEAPGAVAAELTELLRRVATGSAANSRIGRSENARAS
jgi:3-oxoadipate enol-lactonase